MVTAHWNELRDVQQTAARLFDTLATQQQVSVQPDCNTSGERAKILFEKTSNK